MSDLTSEQRRIYAQELKDNPLLQEIRETMEQENRNLWRESGVEDAQGRERLFFFQKAVDSVFAEIERALLDGALSRYGHNN